MRNLLSWTVIFRGHIYRNLTEGAKRFWRIMKNIFRIVWRINRFLLRCVFFIIGIDWIRVERNIERKLRIFIA